MSVLTHVEYPSHWPRVPLGFIAPRVSEPGFSHLQPLSVFLNDGVVPRSHRLDNHNQLGADLEEYQRVLPGDLVFNKLRTWQGGFGVSKHTGIVSPAYIIARPSSAVVPQFLHHFMRSEPVLAELTRLSKWMPPSQFDISWEDIRGVPVALPPIEEQRRVAEFLDDQVLRIDSAIQLRLEQRQMLGLFLRTELKDAFGVDVSVEYLLGLEGQTASLSRMGVRAISGGTPDSQNAEFWTEPGEGTPWISISDMVEGGETMRVGKDLTTQGLAASRLCASPSTVVLFAMYASLGKTSISRMEAVWNQAILGLVPSPRCHLGYLRAWLEYVKPVLPALARSTTQDNFNAQQVLALRIPAKSLDEQANIAQVRDNAQLVAASLDDVLQAAIERLNDYKRSLITAAVTGVLDVTTSQPKVPA